MATPAFEDRDDAGKQSAMNVLATLTPQRVLEGLRRLVYIVSGLTTAFQKVPYVGINF
jgi:hypothetical protein